MLPKAFGQDCFGEMPNKLLKVYAVQSFFPRKSQKKFKGIIQHPILHGHSMSTMSACKLILLI